MRMLQSFESFILGGQEYGKSRKISTLDVGDNLIYRYDFGTPTEIKLTVMSEISRPKQREKVLLLARNEPMSFACESCQAPAAYVYVWENVMVCEACAEEISEDGLLDVTNSPRMGECGYAGCDDRWIFDPNKPFPQTFSAYAKK